MLFGFDFGLSLYFYAIRFFATFQIQRECQISCKFVEFRTQFKFLIFNSIHNNQNEYASWECPPFDWDKTRTES